jgi:L-rhamnose mutarotase
MKYIYLLLLTVVANYTIAQETKDTATFDFIRTNSSELQSKIKNSEKKYKLIWIFCYYCHASQVQFPETVKYVNSRDDIDFYAICDNEHADKNAVKYLQKELYKGSIYVLLTDKKRKLISVRSLKYIESFIKSICSSCDYKKMGASNYLIFDKENNVIAHTTYETDDVEYWKILENLPK